VQDRVVALLRFAGSVGDLSLVTTGDYYYYHKTKNKMVERNWRSGRDMVWVLVGVTGCVPWPWGIVKGPNRLEGGGVNSLIKTSTRIT
jgi:hypothetical protein